MQQNGQRVQEVVVAALKYVHHTDQAAAHVAAYLHLHATRQPQAAFIVTQHNADAIQLRVSQVCAQQACQYTRICAEHMHVIVGEAVAIGYHTLTVISLHDDSVFQANTVTVSWQPARLPLSAM